MAPAARVDAQPAPPASPAATAPAAGPAPPASAAGTPPTGAAATPPDRSSIFRLGAGVSTLDLGGLSPLITGHGYPAIASRVASIGSQLTWQFGRVGVGLTGETFLGTTSSHADVQLQTSGGYGMVELGFAVVRTPTFTVTPVVGVGAGVVRLEFAARDIVSLDSLIGNPRTESTVSGRSFVGELGLSLAVRLPLTWQGEHVT
ncbi:MAG: hypothetical protein HY275_16470, partial [Gemmatimonadetes bacterium]|nr:hypothetical protein [Gemmatimonadota bacterium]